MSDILMGTNGFVWWIGVVENRNDPLKLGGLRVRIVGWHSENLTDMPSDKLPWATPLHPLTETNKSIDVKEGDWVFGFFLDGEIAQKPVVIGCFPGIKTVNDNTSVGFSPQLTTEEKKETPSAPTNVVVGGEKIQEPTTPRTARGTLENTLIAQTNKDLAHVCAFTLETKRNLLFQKINFSQLVTKIRQAIEALIKSLGLSPDSITQRIKDLVTWLRRKIKDLKNIVQEIKDFVNFVKQIAKELEELIAWATTLPQRILTFISQCLKEFTSSIINAAKEFVKADGTSSSAEQAVTQLEDVNTSLDNMKSTTEAITAPNNAAFIKENYSVA